MAKVPGFEPGLSVLETDVLAVEHYTDKNWSGRQDSNLQPPAPKAGALPLAPLPGTWNPRQDSNLHVIQLTFPLVRSERVYEGMERHVRIELTPYGLEGRRTTTMLMPH